MIKEFIGERVREMRKAQGYSQEKFAVVCGLDRTYIAGVEAGKRNISIENLFKIADALNLSLGELCGDNTPPHRSILLNINGENFLLQSKTELTAEIKDEIELLCKCAYEDDEDNPFIAALGENASVDDLYACDVYKMAGLFRKVVKSSLGVDVVFKALDLEVGIIDN